MSEVLQNKRHLNKAHVPKLVRLLGLDVIEGEVFKILHEKDVTKTPAHRKDVDLRLEKARKALTMSYQMLPPELGSLFFAFKVFAAFGLFENKPTRGQLVDFFGRSQYWDVDCAIALLQKHKLIASEGKHFILPESLVLFNSSPDGMSTKQFVKLCLLDSLSRVDAWFDQGDLSRFHSTILCVKKTDYERYLIDLRSRLIREQAELANPKGDFLVHFNVNLYPVDAGTQNPKS